MQNSPKSSRSFNFKAILWIILACFAVSCSPLVREGQTAIYQQDAGIQAGESVGQSFLATYAGLAEIHVFLAPDSPGDGRVVMHLRASPGAESDLAAVAMPLSEVSAGRYYPFQFDPQPDSFLKTYYLSLEIEGSGAVRYGSAGPTDYVNGSLYQNDQPVDGQLAFQLAYDPAKMAGGLLSEGLRWIGWLLLIAVFFILPGMAVLRSWSPSLSLLAGVSLGAGLSMALYALLLLWGQVFNLRLGAWYAWGMAGVGALLWITQLARHRPDWQGISLRAVLRSPRFLPTLFLIVVVGLAAFSRLWAFRTAAAPFWGDSVHHTAIAQLILDHDGLFQSWMPYASYNSLTVQYGFSGSVAVWAWVTGQPIQQAVVVFGQLLNLLAVVAWYPLACRLAKGNRWAGVAAVIVAGLLTTVPGFYSNWGRYAQLAGQTVLPAALWVTWDLLEQKRFDWRGAVMLGACLAGMLLCYYRMAFFYASFVLVLLVVHWLTETQVWKERWGGLGSLAAAVLVLIGLLTPWILQVSGSSLAGSVISGMAAETPLQSLRNDYANWGYVTAFVSLPLLFLAGLGGAMGLLRRQWLLAGLLVWVALLAAVRAAVLIHFPGANMMMSTAVMYFLYAPVGLLVGWLCGEALAWLRPRTHLGWMAGLVVLGVAALWGARLQSRMMQWNPYGLVTWPDRGAADWIDANTPADALFLVEGFRIYGGVTAVGSDAGWWLPLLAGRANTMPPQYALVEQPLSPGYTQRVVDLVALLEEHSPASPEGMQALCSWGITHVYIGQERGLASMERLQLFAPEDFDNSPAFTQVYAQDRVRIYAFDTGVCP